MEKLNPYKPPETDPTAVPEPREGPFAHLDFKGVQRLRNHSHSVRAIGLLGLLGALLGAFLAVNSQSSPLILGIGFLAAGATYASWWRPVWGQVIGIIFCAMLLLGFPVGTVLGLLGIVAFAQGRELFGPDRLRHGTVEREWRLRKRERWRQRRGLD